MRHHGGETAVGGGHRGKATRAAVRVEGIVLGRPSVVIGKTQRSVHLGGVAARPEVGVALAVGNGDGHARAGHAVQEQRRRVKHFHHRQPGFEALAQVGGETRPMLRAGNHVGEFGKHLAAVTNAQCEAVAAREEVAELLGQILVEGDRARPADSCTQRIAITEATTGDQSLEIGQADTAALQVTHVHIEGLEAGFAEGVGHLDLRIDALLAQHRHARARQQQRRGWRCSHRQRLRQVQMQSRVARITCARVLSVSAHRVVTALTDLPADRVPDLLQVLQPGRKNALGIAPDLHLAHAGIDRRTDRPCLGDAVAVPTQPVRTQPSHHFTALRSAHLQHHAELFVEQRLERQFLSAGTDLLRPVLAVPVLGPAVAHTVALGDQQVEVHRHANLTGKCHFADSGKQAAVTAVVVSQDQLVRAQIVHRVDQSHQVLRVVEVRHHVADLIERLRQHAGGHAHTAAAEVDQHQRGVGFAGVERRRQRAAHIGQGGEGGDDQRHRRGDFALGAVLAPLGSHRQRIFAHRDRYAQRRAQLQTDGPNRLVQRRILAGLTAGCHPVGRELDPVQRDGRGEQIGDRLGHRHAPRRRSVDRRQRGALSHRHRLALKAAVVGQRDGAVGHRNLPPAHHLVAMAQPAHAAVADGDQETLGGDRRARQHIQARPLQVDPAQIQRPKAAHKALHVAVHARRLAQQHVHRHAHGHCLRRCRQRVGQHQFALGGRDANDREGAAFARAQRLEQRQRLRRDGHHVALLAFVAPDLLGAHAAAAQRNRAQREARAAPCVVAQLGEGIGQAAGAHIVDGQYRVVGAHQRAMVDHLLRAPLHLRVAALHRVEVQRFGVGPCGHRTCCAAAHADAHARPAELQQQAARGKSQLMRLALVDGSQSSGDHDRLVVAALHRVDVAFNRLLVLSKVTEQIRTAELVVESGTTQRPLDHDLQRVGNMARLAVARHRPVKAQARHAKAGQPGLGLGAAPGGAFVADLAARTR